ncbi:MAG TPA: DNA gyrase subunit A [Anaerolineales bacterium]|nr:DNA gyrase subunit A [Anaerolineales bacterium]
MDIGQVKSVDINAEMQAAYLSYAMSVIVARALPDARDGLKPVQRRILYAMHDMGLRPSSPYKKSARIVGEVLGKYHPHGDQAVYDAMARMAQDFSMRYLLVDGQGNFGSVDGDAPAAMRYTEARLHSLAAELLHDLEKDTVEFTSNFDDTLKEPAVLPATAPNLLINGSQGIAVGMATSIPPHNLAEVCEACIFMLESWGKLDDVTTEDLMRFVKGPDFPTGGLLVTSSNEEESLAQAYGSGRGKITMQAALHKEEMGRGRERLIVTEIPYLTNKASLIERIAELVREERLEGIGDLRDESDRQGMRIVIELAKGADTDKVVQQLYKYTPLQSTFSIILLALVNGEPRMLSLKQALRVFLEHRQEIVRRRSEFDLQRAKERAHILEGLLIAINNLDEVIATIRNSPDTPTARERLMNKFKLSEIQATAILEMPLKRIAKLERQKLQEEYKEVQARIQYLEKLLASPQAMREVIAEELRGLKTTYGDRRRTRIIGASDAGKALMASELVPEEDVIVVVNSNGTLSRLPAKGRLSLQGQVPLAMTHATTRDTLYLFSSDGRSAALPVHAVPISETLGEGVPWMSVSAFRQEDNVVAALSLAPEARSAALLDGQNNPLGPYLVMASSGGMVKKLHLADLPGPSSAAFTVMNIAESDELIAARLLQEQDEILLLTGQGQGIRFKGAEVRAMGLAAAGVQGVKLNEDGDGVVAMEIVATSAEVLVVTSAAQGKRTTLQDYPLQGRYGKGVLAWKLTANAVLCGGMVGTAKDSAVLLSSKGKATLVKLDKAPARLRSQRGEDLLTLGTKETLVRVIPLLNRYLPPKLEETPAKKAKKSKS